MRMSAYFVFVLTLMSLLLHCSCTMQGSKAAEETDIPDPSAAEYISYTVPLDLGRDDWVRYVIDLGDDICVVCGMYSVSDDSYRIMIIDKDTGNITSSNDTVLQDAFAFCATKDNKIACTASDGYIIVEPYTGKIFAKGKVPGAFTGEDHSVALCDEGFVYITPDMICKVSGDGSIIDSMELDIEGILCHEDPYFIKNGREYIRTTDNDESFVNYYELDFDSRSAVLRATDKTLDINLFYAPDYGKYFYDHSKGEIYELDPEHLSKAICAYRSNMPHNSITDATDHLYILNRSEYVASNLYNDGRKELVITRAKTVT